VAKLVGLLALALELAEVLCPKGNKRSAHEDRVGTRYAAFPINITGKSSGIAEAIRSECSFGFKYADERRRSGEH